MERSNWLVLEDEGWKIIIPETDTGVHSTEEEGEERELAWAKCPCGPKVDFQDQIIIHNSFEEQHAIEMAIQALSQEKTEPVEVE